MAKLFSATEKQPHTEIIRIQHKDTGHGPYLTDNEEVNRIMAGSNLPSPQTSLGFEESDIQHLEDPKIPKKFGFLNEEMMHQSISPEQLKALKAHGYEPVKVKAANVWGNNRQVFFSTPEQHEKANQQLKQKTKYRELSPEEIKAMNEKMNKSLAEKFMQKVVALNDLLNLRDELIKGMTEQERANQKAIEEKLKASPSFKQAALRQNKAETKTDKPKKGEKKESKEEKKHEPKEEYVKPKSEKEFKPSKPNYKGSAHGESHVAVYNNGHRYTGLFTGEDKETGEEFSGRSRTQNKVKVHHTWDHGKKEWKHSKTENVHPGLDVEGNEKKSTAEHKAEKAKEKPKSAPKSNVAISEEEKKKYAEKATTAKKRQEETDKQSKLKSKKLPEGKKLTSESIKRAQKHVDEAKKPKTIRRKSDGSKVESKSEKKSDSKSSIEETRKKLDKIKSMSNTSRAQKDSDREKELADKREALRIKQAKARRAKMNKTAREEMLEYLEKARKEDTPGKLSKGMNNAGLGGPGSVKLGNVLPSLKATTSAGKVNTTNSSTPSLGITQSSKKDPMKQAEQVQNKDIKDIKMKEAQQQLVQPAMKTEAIKFDDNGQWSLEKGAPKLEQDEFREFPYPKTDAERKAQNKYYEKLYDKIYSEARRNESKPKLEIVPEKKELTDTVIRPENMKLSLGNRKSQLEDTKVVPKEEVIKYDDNGQWSLEKRCWKGYEPTPGKKPYEEGSCKPVKKKDIEVAPEGSKNRETYKDEFEKKEDKPFHGYNKEKHSREGGMSAKAREKHNRETGSNLQKPVTSKEAKSSKKKASRRKSFCARMSGVKGPTSKDGKLTRKGAALKRWDC